MKTVFYQAVIEDCEAETLDMAGMIIISTDQDPQQAAEELFRKKLKSGKRDYSVTYTAGHYGEELHAWDFSHYEIYEPLDPALPSMVILRYKPRLNTANYPTTSKICNGISNRLGTQLVDIKRHPVTGKLSCVFKGGSSQ